MCSLLCKTSKSQDAVCLPRTLFFSSWKITVSSTEKDSLDCSVEFDPPIHAGTLVNEPLSSRPNDVRIARMKAALAAGHSINALHSFGRGGHLGTPVHSAIDEYGQPKVECNIEILNWLLDNGASPCGLNSYGETPLGVIQEYRYTYGQVPPAPVIRDFYIAVEKILTDAITMKEGTLIDGVRVFVRVFCGSQSTSLLILCHL